METYQKWAKSEEKNKEITKPILAQSKTRKEEREAQQIIKN
jgi:hypothetical protein